jgi:hypothetical protein
MIIRNNRFFAIGLLLGLLIVGPIALGRRPVEVTLDKQLQQSISAAEVNNLSLWGALSTLAEKHKVLIGFEAMPPTSGVNQTDVLNMQFQQGTIEDLLNEMMQIHPEYKWVKSRGVINVMPSAKPNPLLELMISDFRVEKVTGYEASQVITDLPEVQAALPKLGLTRRELLNFSGAYDPTKEKRITLELHNVTVRQIMNKILQASGKDSWIFSIHGDKNQYFLLRIDRT